MSYRNPKIFASDPTAFSRGFDVAFQKQQQAFQADIEERKRLAEEADTAMAMAYEMSDLGAIKGIDLKFNEALQSSLNSIIENGDFANASAADKAKMIQQMQLKKAAFQRIGEIMSVENEDWDRRNDPTLTAFRTAVMKGEDLSIDSKGLDFKVKGSFGEITLDDIANKRIFNKAAYEENLNKINDGFAANYGKVISEAYRNGKSEQEINQLKDFYKNSYASLIKNSDPDFKSYLQYNVAETKDEEQMIDNMFSVIDSKIIPPNLVYNQPKPKENKKPKLLGLDDDQRQTAISNLFNLAESKLDEDKKITKESPFYQIRMKGPNDIVPTTYKFRKIKGKYYYQKNNTGDALTSLSEQDLFDLFGFSEEYKKYNQKQKQENAVNMLTERYEKSKGKFGDLDVEDKIEPIVFDGSN
jgi:hypothetical protein